MTLREEKLFYESGNLQAHCFYEQNKLHNEYKQFYIDGQIAKHCFYSQGDLHGEYKFFYENGQIEKHCFYDQGNEISIASFLENPNNPTETDIVTLSLMFDGNIIAREEQAETASGIRALLQKWLNKISLLLYSR